MFFGVGTTHRSFVLGSFRFFLCVCDAHTGIFAGNVCLFFGMWYAYKHIFAGNVLVCSLVCGGHTGSFAGDILFVCCYVVLI